VGGAHLKFLKCIVVRSSMYTNTHLSLHTHYMYKTRFTTDGRWDGRVGGAPIKLISCIVLRRRSSMYTNKHLSLHTHHM
jgi:hypothetical protein